MTSKFGLNPWVTIWTQPRKTIRAIVENNPKYGFFYLASILGISSAFFSIYLYKVAKENFLTTLILNIIIAPFLGVISLYFNAWILQITGKIFKGDAPFLHIRAALSWSKVTYILPICMWLVLLAMSPNVIISQNEPPTTLFVSLIFLISSIWAFIILLRAIQEVQKFSVWISFFNIIIAFIISSIAMYIFGIILSYVVNFFIR